MVEILPAWENTKPVFHICMNLNHFKPLSVCCLLGFLFLKCWSVYGFILLAKRKFNRKACFWKTVKGCARQYGSLWEQPQPIGQTSRMQRLSSPPRSLNCRESRKVRWRPRPTMDSHGIAGPHFSCNWLCFWSLILEGEHCYSPHPINSFTCVFVHTIYTYIHTINILLFSKKWFYRGKKKRSFLS